jgi:hypothetical protein
VTLRVQFSWQKPNLPFQDEYIDLQCHFVRDMVERKKVLLEKVDTLKNIPVSLAKYVSDEEFSWCRETMGIGSLGE